MKSNTYRIKLKNLTELVKGYYPLIRRIPATLPPINSEPNKISSKLSAKDAAMRKENFSKQDAFRLDRASIAYWLTPSN